MPSQRHFTKYLLTCLISSIIAAPFAAAEDIKQESEQTIAQTALDEAVQTPAGTRDATKVPVQVSTSSRPLTIAVLMPSDDSPLLDAAQKITNGLIAASKTSAKPADVLVLGSPNDVPASEQIDAAIINGADVVIGPIQREKIQEIAAMDYLPIPVVALNSPSAGTKIPDNMVMLTVSTEAEAAYIVELATRGLEPTTAMSAPNPSTDEDQPTTSAEAAPQEDLHSGTVVLKSSSAWSERTANVIAAALSDKGITPEIILVDQNNLDDVQERLAPKLSDEEAEYFRSLREQAQEEGLAPKELKQKLRLIREKERLRTATSEPPYATVFLALAPNLASLVRSRIPIKSKVWATSVTNPGDPATSSTSATLAYDLSNIVFVDSPIIAKYDASTFEARFATAMPYAPSSKRLFALGVDAYEVAQQWATKRTNIQFFGETGEIRLNTKTNPEAVRIPQTMVIQNGRLVSADEGLLDGGKKIPQLKIPERPALPDVNRTLEEIKPSAVVPATAEPSQEPDVVPSRPISPLKIEQ